MVMKLPFIKMQGAGNDYIYVNGFKFELTSPQEVAKVMSDRHFGVGADGLVLILPSEVADCRMRMFNADGSEGMMCGNAIRCVGKWAYEHGGIQKREMLIETLSGVKQLSLKVIEGHVQSVTVNMGEVSFDTAIIPIDTHYKQLIEFSLTIDGKEFQITGVSVGNPHAVIFMQGIELLPLEVLGPKFEHHSLFPQRINTEFVEVVSPKEINMRVWERGSGETLACGTGACAAVAAGVKSGRLMANEEVKVNLIGGTLYIEVDSNWRVTMRGNAVEVFEGVMEINN